MRIALLSDIHANREALSACLDHARASQAEHYVFLGDYVGYGADPDWAVSTIMAYVERGATAIQGNHDAAIFSRRQQMNDTAQTTIEWTRGRLNPTQLEFLQHLPLVVEQGELLFVHANAWAPDRWGYITGPRDAGRSLQATRCRITCCGHVHSPQLYYLSATGKIGEFTPVSGVAVPMPRPRRWVAVIGAVGQPRDGNPAASYAILDDKRHLLTFVRVPYDIDSAARKIGAAGLPLSLAMRLEDGY